MDFVYDTQSNINLFVPNALFLYSRKTLPSGFLMFTGGSERVRWERMCQLGNSAIYGLATDTGWKPYNAQFQGIFSRTLLS